MGWNPLESYESAKLFYENVNELNRERGAIIGIWAAVESALDHANKYAWHYTDKSISKVVPQNLRWKIEVFEQVHLEVPPLAPLREQADELLSDIKRLFEERHWMAHGYLLPEKSDPDGWMLTKGEFLRDGGYNLLERRFSKAELSAIRDDVLDLSLKVARYASAVARQIGEHGVNDDRR
jgi:hypothetical protein